MLTKKLSLFLTLSCFFFQVTHGYMSCEKIESYLGKPLYSYVLLVNLIPYDQWFYTTDLSKLLLVGDTSGHQLKRALPLVGYMVPWTNVVEPMFDTRFESFIKHVGQHSQQQMQEAIKDAIILTKFCSTGYSITKLLDRLENTLQNKVFGIHEQLEHNFAYDQPSLRYMKKSFAWTVGLLAVIALTNKFVDYTKANEDTRQFLINMTNLFAILGTFPASYKTMHGCYKTLVTDPNACNTYLKEYEELLMFVQKIKEYIKNYGAITFKLVSGSTVTGIISSSSFSCNGILDQVVFDYKDLDLQTIYDY